MNLGALTHRELFPLEPRALRELLADAPPSLWEISDFRQTTFAVHRHTQSIVYVWSRPDDDDYAAIETHLGPDGAALHAEVWRIAEQIRAHFSPRATITKLMLAKLRAGADIREHFDGGNLAKIHRCHLPVITNAGCTFFIDRRPHHFPPTAVVEINNQQLHGFVNASDEDRVHLICDVLEGS